MPERARVFTLSEEVARKLDDTPCLSGRVHRFTRVRGLELPPSGLFVARVPCEVWTDPSTGRQRDTEFDHQDMWGPGQPVADYPDAWSTFGWLADVRPPEVCRRFLRAVADAANPLVYYHQMERGDDMYYEFGWLAGADEELAVHQTWLMGREKNVSFRGGQSEPSEREWVLETALVHLGLPEGISFFWPDDELVEEKWPPLD